MNVNLMRAGVVRFWLSIKANRSDLIFKRPSQRAGHVQLKLLGYIGQCGQGLAEGGRREGGDREEGR